MQVSATNDEQPLLQPETLHIPVAALGANAMPRHTERGLQAGFFRYLTKPIQVDEFMNTLDAALALSMVTVSGTFEETTR